MFTLKKLIMTIFVMLIGLTSLPAMAIYCASGKITAIDQRASDGPWDRGYAFVNIVLTQADNTKVNFTTANYSHIDGDVQIRSLEQMAVSAYLSGSIVDLYVDKDTCDNSVTVSGVKWLTYLSGIKLRAN